MQRRHYVFLAHRISHDKSLTKQQVALFAKTLATWFSDAHPSFNKISWYKACGVTEEEAKEILNND